MDKDTDTGITIGNYLYLAQETLIGSGVNIIMDIIYNINNRIIIYIASCI